MIENLREECRARGLEFPTFWLPRQTVKVKFTLIKSFIIDSKSGAPGGTRTPDLLVRSQTLYPTELRARSVSPSTIPRCDAKLQLCSPDFVAHVAQLSPAPKCQPWESRSRVPPFPPIMHGTSGSPPTACRTGSCLWRIVISPMIPQDSPS